MTFCLGITVRDGLVGIADTRVTSGNECITARKVSCYDLDPGAFFVMTSGLRSIRDKALTYFHEVLETEKPSLDRLYKVVNLFAKQIRAVAEEDKEALQESGLPFSIFALLGGQLSQDKEHRCYLVYPQGNWVEIGPGTPYHIIGEGGYGKPVLDRTLQYADSIPFALKVGCLSFDSTRISAADVDFPIDVVLYARDSFRMVEHRYEKEDLQEISTWWQESLRRGVNDLPSEWIDNIMAKLTRQSSKNSETDMDPAQCDSKSAT
jgi:putative proteasome-type protease